MAEILRVLIVKDLPTDAGLEEREVRRVLPNSEFLRVETREDFLAALESFKPDFILSDHKLPHFDGMSALKLAQERVPEIPFVIIAGPMNESIAVECMKAGAWDYVIKEHIERLGTAVLNGLEQKLLRAKRKETGAALLRSEERFRLLYESSRDAIMTAGLDEGFLGGNRAAIEMFGCRDEQEFITLSPAFASPEFQPDGRRSADKAQEMARLALKQGSHFFEWTHKRMDGTEFYADVLLTRMELGGKTLLQATVRDITEQELAVETLRRNEEYLARLMNTLGDAVFNTRLPERRIEYVNQAATTIFGYQPEEMIGQTTRMFFQDDAGYAAYGQRIQDALAEGRSGIFAELELLRKNGQTFWGSLHTTFFLSHGQSPRIISTIRDITDRKRAEDRIRRQYAITQGSNRILEAALKTATEEELGMICLAVAEEITSSKFGFIGEIGEDGTTNDIAISDPGWELCTVSDKTGHRRAPGQFQIHGIYGRVLIDGKGFFTNDPDSHPDRIGTPPGHPPLEAFLGVPLISNRKTIGMIAVANRAMGYDQEQLEALETLAPIIGEVFLHRRAVQARRESEERLKRQLDRLTALRIIDMTISGSLDIRVTFNVILEQIVTSLGVDAAAVLILNSQGYNRLSYVAGRGFRTDALRYTSLSLGEGSAGRVAQERKSIYIPDLQKEPPDFLKQSPHLRNEHFVTYHAVPLIAKGYVKGVLEIFNRTPFEHDQEWLDFLEALATQAAIAIDNVRLFDDLQKSNIDLIQAYDSTLEGWSNALDLRDKATEGHSQRVTDMTLRLAGRMGMKDSELVQVRRGAMLHDIGKMAIPDDILLKPGPLNDDEWELMRKHPEYAYELLYPISYLRPALDIPYCHHEKWDGTGYPRGLKGEYIPLAARIFAIVDVWDALRSGRPYGTAWSDEMALEYIKEQTGKQFDPKVVEAFLTFLSERG